MRQPNSPENEGLPFNRPGSGMPRSNVSSERALGELLDLVKDDRNNVEKTMPIIATVGTIDGQILANVEVPFNFNSIVLCVSGGIVAVTHGDVPPDNSLTGPSGELVAAESYNFNWLFGSAGVTPGSVASANAQPIALFTGPQEIRFRVRERGQKLTFWIHHDSNLALRASIDPDYAKVILVGAVEYLR
jgi:hypothetical protein